METILHGGGEGWLDEPSRLRCILDFVRGRALAVPMKRHEGRMKMARYRTQGRLMFANSASEYADILFYIEWKFGIRARGMYATNAVYKERLDTLDDCNQLDNVESYLGYIDIDNVKSNVESGLIVIRDCLSKLPRTSVWLLVSGSGVHINVNGFRSCTHAQSFFEARGVVDDRKNEVEVHLLNDKSRIGTVPWEVYKKDDRVACFTFMPGEVDDVFDREDWRAPFVSKVRMPWRMPVSPEVEAWNLMPLGGLVEKERKASSHSGVIHVTDHLDPEFWSALPGCIVSAFEKDVAPGQYRVIGIIALFMHKVGIPDADIRRVAVARNASFSNPLEPGEVDRVVDDVLAAGLEPPGCAKLRWKKGGGFPILDAAELGLCPLGKDRRKRCIAISPWRQYCINRRCKT